MARTKQYNEEEVIEKAMRVFWRHGYGGTSVRTLEKDMGINQFSIYSSFQNKRGVLLASLRCYKGRMQRLVDKLEASPDGTAALKAYFHDFLDFALAHGQRNGCLFHNTLGELAAENDPAIRAEIAPFVESLSRVLRQKLATDTQGRGHSGSASQLPAGLSAGTDRRQQGVRPAPTQRLHRSDLRKAINFLPHI